MGAFAAHTARELPGVRSPLYGPYARRQSPRRAV